MGDPAKVYQTHLTEPEINGIFGFVAFVESACREAGENGGSYFARYWEHYGPTMQALSDRLARDFDDSVKPSETKDGPA